MANNISSTIARIWKAGSELGVRNRRHVMVWISKCLLFLLDYIIYGSIWVSNMGYNLSISTFSYKSAVKTKAHIHHHDVCLLKSLLGVKKANQSFFLSETHCLLRETGQMPLYFYWFRCVIRFWNSLRTTNSSLLSQTKLTGCSQPILVLAVNRAHSPVLTSTMTTLNPGTIKKPLFHSIPGACILLQSGTLVQKDVSTTSTLPGFRTWPKTSPKHTGTSRTSTMTS